MGDGHDSSTTSGSGTGGASAGMSGGEDAEVVVSVNNDSAMSGDDGGGTSTSVNTAEHRLQELERVFLEGPMGSNGQSYSTETLLDVLLVLYDECTNSSLRREKTVSDFIEFGKYIFYDIIFTKSKGLQTTVR